ncbi:unnamed protein product [Rotaria socialis]|uniref:Uncharacterized protein n=3 Tax=Rotaria socialis TaxID=392032 RepID=A0A817TK11_9BILA|nr:unnamed protein product [Rotaria socialis]CAF3347253.1 unnamed protein product [Rotaria socialis]CAF4182892.1 unnamed protein product [Rotaria socialis]
MIIDPRLKLHHFTLSGTHNSYHKANIIAQYEHTKLESQLDAGVRQFELDIHLMENYDVIYHLQLFDDKTNCYCLSQCLLRIRRWSIMNPTHHPIFLFFEIKQKFYEDMFTPLTGGMQCRHIQNIKRQLLEVFSNESLILSEQVRGSHSSLRLALKQQRDNELNGSYTYDEYGWPPLISSLGKILPVILDEAYNRAVDLFNNCEPLMNFFFIAQAALNRPYSSIVCVSNPLTQQQQLIENANNGLITRILLGYGSQQLFENYKLALKYGIHIISTDSVQCDDTPLCRSIATHFSASSPVLCNRLTRPTFCNRTFSDLDE